MEGHPTDHMPDHTPGIGQTPAEVIPGVPTTPAPFDATLPEDAITLRDLGRNAEFTAAQIFDLADYLGLAPEARRGGDNTTTWAFSQNNARSLTEFILSQSRSNDEPVLGESNS